jgi:hypothetical protein
LIDVLAHDARVFRHPLAEVSGFNVRCDLHGRRRGL